jgi:hypothetical protein
MNTLKYEDKASVCMFSLFISLKHYI